MAKPENKTKLREQYPEGPGTIPPKVVQGPLPEKLPDLIPKKWPATEEDLTLAQRFNEILKAYGVLFSDDAMRSRLIIDLMSEVTGGTLTILGKKLSVNGARALKTEQRRR